jgi:hypothetical protein
MSGARTRGILRSAAILLGATLLVVGISASEESVQPASSWRLPDPGSCADPTPEAQDARPSPSAFAEGKVVGFEQLSALADENRKNRLRSSRDVR